MTWWKTGEATGAQSNPVALSHLDGPPSPRQAGMARPNAIDTVHTRTFVRTPFLMLSLMRPQSSLILPWPCSVEDPPSDLQRNCTVSPRAESRSLACFILANRGQARLTSTSPRPTPSPTPHPPCPPACLPACQPARPEAFAGLNFSTDEASCAPLPSLTGTPRVPCHPHSLP